jgi:hypothetical protein
MLIPPFVWGRNSDLLGKTHLFTWQEWAISFPTQPMMMYREDKSILGKSNKLI